MGAIGEAVAQSWPPFVLVAGLLLIGAVDEADGLFAALGARAERLGGGPVVLLAALLGLEAVVTAVLNLDTAVVFMTPIALHAARQRECDVRPFLYGALFMANGASLLLPGSNLTNLIVLHHSPTSGAAFAKAMALPWVVVVALDDRLRRGRLPAQARGRQRRGGRRRSGSGSASRRLRAATVLILALHNAALPVLAVGARSPCSPAGSGRGSTCTCIGAPVRAGGRARDARARLGRAGQAARRTSAAPGAAALGAVSSVVVNNLPAAALLAAQPPPHPLSLLIGLNLGPSLAFTGSLSAYLWYRSRPGLGRAAVAEDVVRARARARADHDRRRARPRWRARPDRRSPDEMLGEISALVV